MVALIFALLAIATLAELVYSVIFLQLYLQRKRAIYSYFMVFTGVAIFWSLGTALMLFARNLTTVHVGYWLFLIAPMLSTLYILYFCQLFIKGKTQPIYFAGVLAIVGYALLLALSGNLITVDFAANGLNAIHPNRLFYLFYGLYFIIYFDISIFTLRQHHKEQDRTKYFQAKNILYGTGLTGTFGVFTNIALPALGITQYVWIGPLFSLIFLSFATIAISRYKLLDIKGTVIRSTSYVFSVLIIAGVYSTVVAVIFGRTLLSKDASILQWMILSLVTAIVATAFAPIQGFFNKLSAKLFYRDSYEPQKMLGELNNVLISSLGLNTLLHDSAHVINASIKAEFCVFGVRETKQSPQKIIGTTQRQFSSSDIAEMRKYTPKLPQKIIVTDTLEEESKLRHLLRKNDIAVVARLTDNPHAASSGIGYIVLGSKKNGSPYSAEDLEVLEIISDQMVIAVQNALRFEEIQNFNITLQQKVEEATRQLRKSNERLKQLDTTKDDFISMASHQLRTPLTAVKGYVSMVLDGDAGKLNSNQQKLLDQAYVSSQRMVYLIADLLNVSRLKTGKFIIESMATNLADVVEGEVAQLQETAKSRNLTLTYDKPKHFPELMLDETKIRQVVMNFADNAIYYTPAGGHIIINLTDTPTTVEFTVNDDGIGVPKSEQHHLFNKFYRAGNAKKARPDGTGLGLFMAKKVIVAQGGAVIFKSQEGKGSSFGFSFPKAKLLPPEKPATK